MAAVTDTRKRVKLYSFTDNLQWEDLGTGQIMLTFMERMQGIVVIVRSEEDGKNRPDHVITTHSLSQDQFYWSPR